MKKIHFIIPAALVLATYVAVNFKIHQQVKEIKNDVSSATNCNYVSTEKFLDGEKTDTKHLLYRCFLRPDIKTLFLYVDSNTGEIVKSRLIPTNYESLVGTGPSYCITRSDENITYDVCQIFIAYDNFFTRRREFFFSTPKTINNG